MIQYSLSGRGGVASQKCLVLPGVPFPRDLLEGGGYGGIVPGKSLKLELGNGKCHFLQSEHYLCEPVKTSFTKNKGHKFAKFNIELQWKCYYCPQQQSLWIGRNMQTYTEQVNTLQRIWHVNINTYITWFHGIIFSFVFNGKTFLPIKLFLLTHL